MAVLVVSQIRLKRPRKFHLCFTWCRNTLAQTPDNQHFTRDSSGLVFRSPFWKYALQYAVGHISFLHYPQKRAKKLLFYSYFTPDFGPITVIIENLAKRVRVQRGLRGFQNKKKQTKANGCIWVPGGNKNGHFCSRRDARARERERFHGFLFPTEDHGNQ